MEALNAPLCWLDGRYLPLSEAAVPPDDLGLQRGYGIFDFLRVMGRVPLYMEDHLDRFYRSAERMYLDVPVGRDELRAIILRLAEVNALTVSGMRFLLTGGSSPDGYTISAPRLMVMHQPLNPPPAVWPEHGYKLYTHDFLRQMPEVKTIDYLMAIRLQPWLKAQGGDDILYRHDGWVTECPRANFFIIDQSDSVVTPMRNMLHGVTRLQIIQVARSIGLKVEERDLPLTEVLQAKEAFISSSTKRIIPVSRIDARSFNSSEVTRRLWEAMMAHETGWILSRSPD
jgi:branched-subunit amino acid aminotransferase/4-amino-4-deoxychorismate lyase